PPSAVSEQISVDDHPGEEHGGDRQENERSAQVPGSVRIGHRVPRAGVSSRHLTVGGVSNECHGAGDGNVHSRPSAPSQGLSAAGSPPLMHLMITHRKISCARPNPKAPTVTRALKSANCIG